MYTNRSTLFTQCSAHNTVYIIQSTPYRVCIAVYTAQFIQYSVHNTLYTIHAKNTVYMLHYTQWSVHKTVTDFADFGVSLERATNNRAIPSSLIM